MALATQLRQLRFSIHTWPGWVRTNPAPNSLISLFIRLHRWLWVIRLERPHLLLAYPLLFSPWAWICTLSVAEPRYFPFFILTHAVVSASLAGFCRLSAATTSAAWQCTPWALLRAWLNTIAAEILLLCAWCYMMLGPRRLAWGRQHLSLSRKYLDQPPNP
jgi:hypothetical protein